MTVFSLKHFHSFAQAGGDHASVVMDWRYDHGVNDTGARSQLAQSVGQEFDEGFRYADPLMGFRWLRDPPAKNLLAKVVRAQSAL